MIDDILAEEVLKKIVYNPDILDSLNMPNINFPTMGGEFFWNDLAHYNGWKIQQNTITHHCRILDSDNCRRAWGGISAMEKFFKKLADNN